jgi:chromosome segregation ATPase
MMVPSVNFWVIFLSFFFVSFFCFCLFLFSFVCGFRGGRLTLCLFYSFFFDELYTEKCIKALHAIELRVKEDGVSLPTPPVLVTHFKKEGKESKDEALTLRRERDRLKVEVEQVTTRLSLAQKERLVIQQQEAARKTELEELSSRFDALQHERKAESSRVVVLEKDVKDTKEQRRNLLEEVSQLREMVNKASTSSAKVVKGSPVKKLEGLNKDLQTRLQESVKQQENLEHRLAGAEQEKLLAQVEAASLKSRANELIERLEGQVRHLESSSARTERQALELMQEQQKSELRLSEADLEMKKAKKESYEQCKLLEQQNAALEVQIQSERKMVLDLKGELREARANVSRNVADLEEARKTANEVTSVRAELKALEADLTASKQSFEREKAVLQAAAAEAKRETEAANVRLESLKKEVVALEKDIDAAEAALKASNNKGQAERTVLEENEQKLEAKLDAEGKKRVDAERERAKVEAELSELREKLATDVQKAERLDSELGEERSKRGAAEKEVARVQSSLSELREKLVIEAEKSKRLDAELDAERSKHAADQKERGRLEAELSELQEKLAKEGEKTKGFDSDLSAEKGMRAALETEVSGWREKLAAAVAELDAERSKYAAEEKAMVNVEAEKSELSEKLIVSEKKRQEGEESLAAVEKRVLEEKEKVASVSKELDRVSHLLAAHDSQRESAQVKLEQLESDRAKLEAELSSLRERLKSDESSGLEKLTALEREMEEAKATLKQQEQLRVSETAELREKLLASEKIGDVLQGDLESEKRASGEREKELRAALAAAEQKHNDGLKSVEEERSASEAKVENFQRRSALLEKESAELREKVASFENEKTHDSARAKEALDSVSEKLSDANAKISDLELKIRANEHDESQNGASSSANEMTGEKRRTAFVFSISNFFAEMIMNSMAQEVESLKEKLASVEVRATKAEAENSLHIAEMDGNARVRDEITSLTKEKGDLELRLRLAEQEVANAGARNEGGDEMTKMIMDALTAELEEAKTALAKEKHSYVEEVKLLKEKVSLCEAQAAASESDKAQVKTQVESSASDVVVSACREEISRLTKENGDLQIRVKISEQQNQQAQPQQDDDMTKMIMDALTAEVGSSKHALAKRDAEVLELKASVEELTSLLESGDNEEKVKNLEKQNASLTDEVKALRNRLEEDSKQKTSAPQEESLQEKLARMKVREKE